MTEQVLSRETIAAEAAQDAREWMEKGCPMPMVMNRYPALSEAAKVYSIAFRRYLGSDVAEGSDA